MSGVMKCGSWGKGRESQKRRESTKKERELDNTDVLRTLYRMNGKITHHDFGYK